MGIFAGLMSALTLGACTTPTDPSPVATIQLLPAFDSVEVGSSAKLFVVLLKDASGEELRGRTVEWSSANEAVATVSADGQIHGVSTGQTIITAVSEGKSTTANVKVILPITSIILTPDSLEVALTRTGTIGIQLVGPAGQAITNRQVTWASANTAVATVSASGVVTPLSLGQTTITATAGGKLASAKVVVKPEPLAGVRIVPSAPVLLVRLAQSRQLAAECFNTNGQVLTGRDLKWFSNNPSVAPVDVNTGVVQGLALGQAVITANCEGLLATVTVQVTQVPVSTVAITPGGLTMYVGNAQQLTATPRDSAGNVLTLQGRQVVWSSNNLPVASVSATQGVVQGVSQGTAQVQVTVDGVASPSIVVTVQNVPVASAIITPNPATVRVNSVVQLTVTLRDANGNVLTGRPVTWRSLNESLATVTNNGSTTTIVSGLQVGTVTIEVTVEGVVSTSLVQINP